MTGSYDPDLNLTYWGIGNPSPDWNGDLRPGDNLYTVSVIALDADTGKLKWHYQFTPHDEFDFDSTQVPVLANMRWQSRARKVMMWANRNGVFYVLDRATGEFLSGKPFVKVTWNTGFDEKGYPIRPKDKFPTAEGVHIDPGNQGGTNWYNPSYSPRTGTLLHSVVGGLRHGLLQAAGRVRRRPVLRRRHSADHAPAGHRRRRPTAISCRARATAPSARSTR